MAALKNHGLSHGMRPPDGGRAAEPTAAAANDQGIAVRDFGFWSIHRIPPFAILSWPGVDNPAWNR
jgi:hypothetical protein